MALNVLTTDLTGTISVLNADAGQSMLVPVPAASIGGGARTRIVWRSDGTGDAVTWLEVVALIGTTPGVQIYVDEQLVFLQVTPGVWDVLGAVFYSPYLLAAVTGVVIQDGAQLRNCRGGSGGLAFDCQSTGLPSFAFDIMGLVVPLANFSLARGATVQNSGTAPAIQAGQGDVPGSFFLLELATGGSFNANPAVPVLNATQVTVFCVVEESITETPLGLNTLSSDALSGLGFVQDGTLRAAATDWPLWLGIVANSTYSLDGGQGPTGFRPTNIGLGDVPTGATYYDTTTREPLYWDGLAWQTWDVLGIEPGKRADQSVNAGRVDNPYSSEPILRTQSSGNAAGGFNGGGTGNKSILGFRPSFAGLPLAIVDALSWTWTDLINAGVLPPYMNVILDLNGDGSAFAIGVIDPNGAPGLGMGGATFNPDGSVTWA